MILKEWNHCVRNAHRLSLAWSFLHLKKQRSTAMYMAHCLKVNKRSKTDLFLIDGIWRFGFAGSVLLAMDLHKGKKRHGTVTIRVPRNKSGKPACVLASDNQVSLFLRKIHISFLRCLFALFPFKFCMQPWNIPIDLEIKMVCKISLTIHC